jgi:hypothetical protein
MDYVAKVQIECYVLKGTGDEESHSRIVEVALKCVQRSSPVINGRPPNSAVFELEHFQFGETRLNLFEFLRAFGRDMEEDVFEEACDMAVNSGEF